MLNLPNKISLVRILLIPVFVIVFCVDFPFHYLVSSVIFALAAITDFIDGHIARSRGLVTNLGKFLDPIADKVLVATAFVLMLTEPNVFGLFFGWGETVGAICVCVILARELIISAFRQIAAACGIVLAAEKLGKFKTIFQDICIFGLLFSLDLVDFWYFQKIFNGLGLGLFAIAVVLTIVSGCSYVIKNKSVLKTEK